MQRGRARHTVRCGRWESLHPGRRSGRGPGRRLHTDLHWIVSPVGSRKPCCSTARRANYRLRSKANPYQWTGRALCIACRLYRDVPGLAYGAGAAVSRDGTRATSRSRILDLHGHRQGAHEIGLGDDAHQMTALDDDRDVVVPDQPQQAFQVGAAHVQHLKRRRSQPSIPAWPTRNGAHRYQGGKKVGTMLETTYRSPSNRCTRPEKHALYCMYAALNAVYFTLIVAMDGM